MNLQQFGASIKEKYPQYKDISDEELGQKMLTKYPQYQDIVITEPKKPEIKTGLSGVSQLLGESTALQGKDFQEAQQSTLGVQDLNTKLALKIREQKQLGKDTSRLEQLLKSNNEFLKSEGDIVGNVAPSSKMTNKALAGNLAQSASYLAAPLGAPSIAGRIGVGAAMGALSGTGSAMSENKGNVDILKQGLVGASVGALISGTFEAVGAGLRKLSTTRGVLNKTAGTYNKELQPSSKELTQQIQNSKMGEAFKTVGAKVRDEVDDAGKPLYVGTYQTMNDKAKNTIAQKGKQLLSTLGKYDKTVKIDKNEIAGNIVSEMQDRMGRLSPTELKVLKNEVNRITESQVNPSKALEYKRLFDSKIPDSFWADTADRTKAVAVQARYFLRDNLRKLINEKTADPLVQKLNTSMGLAMDVRRLSSAQLAQRQLAKIGASGGSGGQSLFRAIYGTLIDDMLLNPAITTRISQGLKSMGSKTGQTPLRTIGRNLLIKESTK